MFLKLLLHFCFGVLVACKTCKYTKSDFNCHWKYENDSIVLQFQKEKFRNNEWTGIGFGNDEKNFDGIFFLLSNYEVSVKTGKTSEHGPPTFTSNDSPGINVQSAHYFHHDEMLSANLIIPKNFHVANLDQCKKWMWIKKGSINNGTIKKNDDSPNSKKVCPMECA